jgi:peptidoglycan/xylan/chitin deacetylase (PgdA/CDA1 family)
MPFERHDVRRLFERGVVILSLDTEQIWGYLDLFNEAQFQRKYPDALEAHSKLLTYFEQAGVSATWFLVGGMALQGSDGPRDRRMAGLPHKWTARIPAGVEQTAPLWYRHSFVEKLRAARPRHEIGLHGGLTHFIWTDREATRDVLGCELREGVKALIQAFVRPLSFSFSREQEAHYDLLPEYGIRCYRGRTVARAFQLGRTIHGKLARLFDEFRRSAPIPVWPQETLPGLWNIPASLFLYPIHPSRTRVVGLRSRIERFSKGMEAAMRHRGIFHYCLHPENLTESAQGFSLFQEILERLAASRDRGDIEVLTMADVAARMDAARDRELINAHFPNAASANGMVTYEADSVSMTTTSREHC